MSDHQPYVEPPRRFPSVYCEQSDQVHLLMAAIARAQGRVQIARRTTDGEYGRFASLEDVWLVYQQAFPGEGLAVTQATALGDGGFRLLVTQVTHTSGQWLRSVEPLYCNDPDAQTRKSEVTLVRRMALCALLGIVEGDDDGAQQHRATVAAKAPVDDAALLAAAIHALTTAPNGEARARVLHRAEQKVQKGEMTKEALDRLVARAEELYAKEKPNGTK